MKRVLSIIFGLVLVGCLTGCQSTKVETPVVEAPVVEPHVHPATIRLELRGFSTSGTVEIGLGEKLEFDAIDKDVEVQVFYPGDTQKTWGSGSTDFCKKIEIEYYVYDDNNEILKLTAYPIRPLSEGVINWYKNTKRATFYEDGNLVDYVFLRIWASRDPNYNQYEEQKKEEAFYEYLRETLYKN